MASCFKTTSAVCALLVALAGCGGGGSVANAQTAASGPSGSASSASLPVGPQGPDSAASTPSKPPLTANFGVDADGNGVADRLDAYVSRISGGRETKDAATAYYRLVSRLAAKVVAGQKLSKDERVSVFVALQCYLLSVDADGARVEGLDDEFMRDRNSLNAMYALMGAMNGTLARTTTNKDEMCAAPK